MTLPRRILPNDTYLVTRRCMGRRFLLRPDKRVNQAFEYCLARAAERYAVAVHGWCAMSNHYHLVITDPQGVLPDFMAWLNRQLAMCVKRLRGWDEVVWEPNVAYSAVELSGQAEALDKVAYVLLNPVSAGLVRAPELWPGSVSTLETLFAGSVNAGRPAVWFRESAAERVGLALSAPPCFPDQAAYLKALKALLASRLAQLRAEFRRQGRGFVGSNRVRKNSVTDQPTTRKSRFGSSPTFSALTRATWHAARERLRAFRRAYHEAYRAWRSGKRDVEFPPGTWWVVRCAGAAAAT
jgi:putative transposase